jgi:hypothetical protein
LSRLALINMETHKTRQIIVFWTLVVMPILGVAAGLAKANADMPTLSGIYPVTLADGTTTTTIELDCNANSCAFTGFGTSVALSRSADFSAITSYWQIADQDVLAGGPITMTGRYYEVTDPEYGQNSYWIPSTVGSMETDLLLGDFESDLKSRNGSLGDPSSPVTVQPGVLVLNWKAPLLIFNLSWNPVQPLDDCLIKTNVCSTGVFATLDITTKTQSAADSTTTLIDSPLRNTPVSPADSAVTIVLAVAAFSAVVAAGAAASGIPSMSGSADGSASGSSQRSAGTSARTSNVASANQLDNDLSQFANAEKPTAEAVGTAFTMELLAHEERKDAENIAKPPRIIRNSRIFSRVFYDTGILNAACMRLHPHPMQQGQESPAEPYLARPIFLVTLVFPVVAATIASTALDLGSTWTVALLVSLGFVCAWLSALHGLIYALTTTLLGVVRISSLFDSAGDELTSGFAFDPLTTSLLIVAFSFTPIISSTLFQPRWLEDLTLSIFLKLFWGTTFMFVIALKLSHELQSQISSTTQAFWDPRAVTPAAIGALITVFRFASEMALRSQKSPKAKSSINFLLRTTDLRAGDIKRDASIAKELLGIALCTLVIGFLAFTYTNEYSVLVVICISFIGISLLHLPLRGSKSDRYGHSLLRFQLHGFPSLSNGTKLLVPTVAAVAIGVVISVNNVNHSMAQWISAGFSLLMFLFELYNVKTTKTIDTLT